MREAARYGSTLMPATLQDSTTKEDAHLLLPPSVSAVAEEDAAAAGNVAGQHHEGGCSPPTPPSVSAVAEEDAAAAGNVAGQHHEGGDAAPAWLLFGARNSSAPFAHSMEIVGSDKLRKLLQRAFGKIWEVFSGYDWSSA
jgi:hypothetical protein